MFNKLFLKAIFLVFPCTLFGHELWIDTTDFKVEKDTLLNLNLRNGENFDGFSLGYFDRSVKELYWRQNGKKFNNNSRQGDNPALQISPTDNGLISIIYVSKPSIIKYKDFSKFQNFVIEKHSPNALEIHKNLDFPRENFSELYTRYSKALVGVGTSKGFDTENNLELELVALENPYADNMDDGIEILALYNGNPRAFSNLNVFERSNTDSSVNTFVVKTNDKGVAVVEVKNDCTYLIDNVIIRPANEKLFKERGVIWESLWAALTFSVTRSNGI
jgi:uncharacterized GH25 family protein